MKLLLVNSDGEQIPFYTRSKQWTENTILRSLRIRPSVIMGEVTQIDENTKNVSGGCDFQLKAKFFVQKSCKLL